MSTGLLENILTRTDTLLERFLRPPEDEQPVSFRQYLTDPRKILLIPGENLVDLLCLLDFIPLTLERFPLAELLVLVHPEHAGLIENIPRVRPVTLSHRSPHTFDSVFRKTVAAFRLEKLDWALNLTESGRAETLLAYHSGAKIRIGLTNDQDKRYYNLIVKSIPEKGNFFQKVSSLFQAFQIKGPYKSGQSLFQLTDEERARAEHFLKRRKSARSRGNFIGCALELRPNQKKLERSLQVFIEGLIAHLDPLHLLIAETLVPVDIQRKWTNIKAYTYHFNDMKQMIAVLTACDKVITNSVGLACILGRLGAKVGLMIIDREDISRLNQADMANIQIISAEDREFPIQQVIKFTH